MPPAPTTLPTWDQIRSQCHVVQLRLATRFRGITTREAVLFPLECGWVEFAPFADYDDNTATTWLAAAIDTGTHPLPTPVRTHVPVNATIPAIRPEQVAETLQKFPGATVAKIKVAEPGQTLADDLDRINATLAALGPQGKVRLDANGGWDVATASKALDALAGLPVEYLEQPCQTVPELAAVRKHAQDSDLTIRIAADESIRLASDPHRVARAQAADIAVVKVPPLGGPHRALKLAADLKHDFGMDIVLSSALDTAVGMNIGIATAAALPNLPFACGLATSRLFVDDVAPAAPLRDGYLTAPTGHLQPDQAALEEFKAPTQQYNWWVDRLKRCYDILQQHHGQPPALRDGVKGSTS